MQHVLIIGANGQVGKIIATQMNDDQEFTPVALFRKEKQKDFFEEKGIDYRVVDLEEDVDTIAGAMEGIDAVVFSAGSGGGTGFDKTLNVDLDGAVKSMDAAKQAGVSRFVIVSALHADDPELWEESGIKPYMVAKHYADRMLKESGLDYTILRPGRLFNEEGTGNITIANAEEQRGIPREDVAATVREVLKNDNTIDKVISFNGGDTAIAEAIKDV